ncbi:MAG: adenylyltransferase/cytidyltransferase family protein [Verrucomicrobia bacterium]|nr:adenylyltransferase/cytidyltransferase family protein [Verrucomicrobiota bacterium]
MFERKLVAFSELGVWRRKIREGGLRLVVTNGCFDLLHPGHVSCLAAARAEGDALMVGVNGDATVRFLKGTGRPIVQAVDRALMLAALQSVDGVCIFTEIRAMTFLEEVQPDIYVKGGDYTLETLDQEERRVVEKNGGRIVLLPFIPGHSTTELVQKITR